MNALDLHVLSSSYGEGFPNVIAEAMACGAPCIATDVGDSKIIVGKYGAIVETNNSNDLSKAIIESLDLMSNKDKWEDLRQLSQDHIVRNFDVQRMLLKYTDVWKDVNRNVS